jgi:hypothetical protein
MFQKIMANKKIKAAAVLLAATLCALVLAVFPASYTLALFTAATPAAMNTITMDGAAPEDPPAPSERTLEARQESFVYDGTADKVAPSVWWVKEDDTEEEIVLEPQSFSFSVQGAGESFEPIPAEDLIGGKPFNAGTYRVTAEAPASGIYPAATVSTEFEIRKAVRHFVIVQGSFEYGGDSVNPRLVETDQNGEGGTDVTDGLVSAKQLTFKYVTYGADGKPIWSTDTGTKPTAAGKYYVYAWYAGDRNYWGTSGTAPDKTVIPIADFEISRPETESEPEPAPEPEPELEPESTSEPELAPKLVSESEPDLAPTPKPLGL